MAGPRTRTVANNVLLVIELLLLIIALVRGYVILAVIMAIFIVVNAFEW